MSHLHKDIINIVDDQYFVKGFYNGNIVYTTQQNYNYLINRLSIIDNIERRNNQIECMDEWSWYIYNYSTDNKFRKLLKSKGHTDIIE